MAPFDRDRALSRLVDEERRAPLPALDSARIEARLLERIAQGAAREPAPARPRWALPLAAAAVVALASGGAAWFLRGEAVQGRPSVAATPSAPTVVAGRSVALGAPLRAAEQPLTVEHSGHARWELSPGSVARVTRRDAVIVVRLERGSLKAEVAPRPVPETFVVEAGAVRVAVHGTRFEVAHTLEGVRVAVTEGLVAVSRGAGAAPVMIPGPASQTFPKEKAEPARAATVSGPAHPVAQPSAQAPSRPEAEGAALPLEPTITAVEAGVSRVVDGVQRCFAGYTAARAGIEVTAKSTVSFRVLPEGGVAAVGFEPPLAPGVDACARAELGRLRFAPSRDGIELSRVLELRR